MTEKQLYFRIKVITVTAVIIVLLLLMYILFQFITLSNLNASGAKLQKELDALSIEASNLEEEIEYRNGSTYIEQYARENFGLGYDNESRYVVEE